MVQLLLTVIQNSKLFQQMQQKSRPCPLNKYLSDSRTRFQVELEFVQCLANPSYLNCRLPFSHTSSSTVLAQQGCFEKPAFISYLKYLLYWKDPAYSKYIIYPYCLHFLDLLQLPEFRSELARGQVCRFMDDQVLLHWQHYMRKRSGIISRHMDDLKLRAANATATTTSDPATPSNVNER